MLLFLVIASPARKRRISQERRNHVRGDKEVPQTLTALGSTAIRAFVGALVDIRQY